MSNIINPNQQYNKGFEGMPPRDNAPIKQKDDTLFDNDWTGSAANAIGEAFNNMDEFLLTFNSK